MNETNSCFKEETEENSNIRVEKEMEKQEKHSDQIQPQQPKHREWLNIFLNNRKGGEDMIFNKNSSKNVTETEQRFPAKEDDEKVENKDNNFREQEEEGEKKSIVRGCIQCLQ